MNNNLNLDRCIECIKDDSKKFKQCEKCKLLETDRLLSFIDAYVLQYVRMGEFVCDKNSQFTKL